MNDQEKRMTQEIARFAVGRGITDPAKAVDAWFKHGAEFMLYAERNKEEAISALLDAQEKIGL